jgi:hypothetical protein
VDKNAELLKAIMKCLEVRQNALKAGMPSLVHFIDMAILEAKTLSDDLWYDQLIQERMQDDITIAELQPWKFS